MSDVDSLITKLINNYSSKCDYIDARIIDKKLESISLSNGSSNNYFTNNFTYGVRVLLNGNWGFSYSSNINDFESIIKRAFKSAKLSSGNSRISLPNSVSDSRKIKYDIDPFNVSADDKINLLKSFDKNLRKNLIKQVRASLVFVRTNKWVISPLVNVKQEFTNSLLMIDVSARDNNIIQSTRHYYSKLGGFEVINSVSVNDVSDKLISRINRLLRAKSPKPEKANVVLDPYMTGLFFHEAVGHACEADSVINNTSLMKGRVGSVVASDEVTLIDDPTLIERGFYWYDDEGVEASPTTLIERGVLKGFMHSLSTAGEMNVKPTSNGRVMDGSFIPIPRMSNTLLKSGNHSFDDLVDLVHNGYLVKGFNGGVVDPITGQFSFGSSECFKIENGVITEPLRDVTLAGSINEVLPTIMVGNDSTKTHLTSTCGKDGQSVRVGEYCPSILVKGVIVGGRS